MRIALASTLASPVREIGSESVESLVWLLARELTARGHAVTVFAAEGSSVHGSLVATVPAAYGLPGSFGDWQLCEWVNLARVIERSKDFDVIHSHAYLWGLPLAGLSAAPMVHTLHVMPDDDSALLRRVYRGSIVSGVSHYQWSHYPDLPPCAIVPHGIDPAHFAFTAEPDDYLCFLGRFIPGKGPLRAIETAREVGRRLRLAGPRNDYFDQAIAPLVDGDAVEYVGPVSGDGRSRLLGGARALLYPLENPEPFGLVMIEAMMCGTPVVGLGIGAVPEIIDQHVTGVWTDAPSRLASSVETAFGLDRGAVRRQAEARFSHAAMAAGYVRLYEAASGGSRPR